MILEIEIMLRVYCIFILMESILSPKSQAFFSVLAFFDAKVFSLGLLVLYCVTVKKRVTHDRTKWDHPSLSMNVQGCGRNNPKSG